LVATSDFETEFSRECSNGGKCVDLILKFSVNSDKDYGQLSDWRFTEYLSVFRYREKCLKYLEIQIVLLLHSFAVIYIE